MTFNVCMNNKPFSAVRILDFAPFRDSSGKNAQATSKNYPTQTCQCETDSATSCNANTCTSEMKMMSSIRLAKSKKQAVKDTVPNMKHLWRAGKSLTSKNKNCVVGVNKSKAPKVDVSNMVNATESNWNGRSKHLQVRNQCFDRGSGSPAPDLFCGTSPPALNF